MQAVSAKIDLICEWQGTAPEKGEYESKIYLQFCKSKYSITIPQGLSSEQIQALQIYSYGSEKEFERLNVTAEQIKNLSICMGLSQEVKFQSTVELEIPKLFPCLESQ